MPVLNAVPSTGGNLTTGWYNGRRSARITERVTISANDRFATLTQTLPPYSRMVWGAIRNNAALTINATTNATVSSAAAMAIALVAGTAPTALLTTAITSHLVLGPASATASGTNTLATVAAGAVAAGANLLMPTSAGSNPAVYNTGSTPLTMYLLPYAAVTGGSAASRYAVGTSTAATVVTTGYYFASTGQLDVDCWIESCDIAPAS